MVLEKVNLLQPDVKSWKWWLSMFVIIIACLLLYTGAQWAVGKITTFGRPKGEPTI